MIFIDTDTFVIDRLFPKDNRFEINRLFLKRATERSTSIFNLYELIGITSFNLNEIGLIKLFKGFEEYYNIKILYPSTAYISPNEFIATLLELVFQKITLKMSFQDALILVVAEEHNCTEFITWNTKHFQGRTHLNVQTPQEYLEAR